MCFQKVDPLSMDVGWLPGVAVNKQVLEKFANIFGFTFEDSWCLLFYLRHYMPFEEASFFVGLMFPGIRGWGVKNFPRKVMGMCATVMKHKAKVIAMWPEILEHKDNVVEGVLPGFSIVALTDTIPITPPRRCQFAR